MALRIVVGTSLVLASWVVVTAFVAASGRWLARLTFPSAAADRSWRASLWWGLIVLTVLTLGIALVVPLGSGAAAAVLLGAIAVFLVIGWVLARPRAPRWRRPRASVSVLLAAIGFALGYLAVKAMGPVTNYDTGLYHLGAIRYAFDFTTIPGLANLYFPFGYANAQFPLAAVLGNGPWDGIGYRLLNGAVLVLACTDLASRLLNRRWSWGTFVLLIGLTASLVPLIALSDFLVTSPTSDTSVLLLTVVSSAYLADTLQRRDTGSDPMIALLLACGVVALRPTMAFFALATVVVVLLATRRVRTPIRRARGWVPTLLAVLALAVVVLIRDRMLSGWAMYPLSLFHFDVPWLADDPTGWRDATLAAARDPYAPDHYVVAHSWTWIPAWFGRLPRQWEFWFLAAAALGTAAVIVVARFHVGFPRSWRRLLAAVFPSAIAVAAWFFLSPPSFRFIWGPLFCLAFIPLGAALHALRKGPDPLPRLTLQVTTASAAIAILAVTGYSAVARNQLTSVTEERSWPVGPFSIPYAVAPIPMPPVVEQTMTSGLVVVTPEPGSDQCWGNYPLCTFNMGDTITPRGPSIQDGFTPG